MRIAAFSRKFPPDYKRKWYVVREGRRGDFIVRYQGRTCKTGWSTLNEALNEIESKNER